MDVRRIIVLAPSAAFFSLSAAASTQPVAVEPRLTSRTSTAPTQPVVYEPQVVNPASPPPVVARPTGPDVKLAAGSVALHWTAPGDDLMLGAAVRYDLRYSTRSITASNFAQATPVSGLQRPSWGGAKERYTVSNLTPNVTYYFAIRSQDDRGNWSQISNVVVRAASTLAATNAGMPLSFSAPWPNPAASSVRFGFTLPAAAPVQIDVFDLAGRHVGEVARTTGDPGRNEISWSLRDSRGNRLQPAVYLVRARIGERTWTHRLAVVP
jgi:hypothetical protein